MPRCGLSVDSLSPRKLEFKPRPIHAGFVDNKVARERFSPKSPLFPVSIIPPMYQAQSFTHHHRCIILATDSIFNTLDTSRLDRWAGDLNVNVKIKYVTPKRGFGVTYHSLCVRCIRANSGLNFEITLFACTYVSGLICAGNGGYKSSSKACVSVRDFPLPPRRS